MLFLFWRLILAHLLADFILQTNAIYNLKIKTIWGQALHGAVLFFTAVILTLPNLGHPILWAYLFLVTLLHMIQDTIKSKYFKEFLYPFWPFMADQIMHILVIATIFIFPLPKTIVYIPSHEALIYLLIGYIFATWQATYFIDTFKKTFLKNHINLKNSTDKYFVSAPEKYYGIIERVIFTTLAFFGGWFYLLILPAALGRFLFKNLRSSSTSILGLILSLITASVLRLLYF